MQYLPSVYNTVAPFCINQEKRVSPAPYPLHWSGRYDYVPGPEYCHMGPCPRGLPFPAGWKTSMASNTPGYQIVVRWTLYVYNPSADFACQMKHETWWWSPPKNAPYSAVNTRYVRFEHLFVCIILWIYIRLDHFSRPMRCILRNVGPSWSRSR